MATGTVSIHSFTDGDEDDEGLPHMASNYNARLELRDDFNGGSKRADIRSRAAAGRSDRVLRSRVVRAAADDDEDDDMPSLPGGW